MDGDRCDGNLDHLLGSSMRTSAMSQRFIVRQPMGDLPLRAT